MTSRAITVFAAALIACADSSAWADPAAPVAPPASTDTAGVWETVPDAMRHVQSGLKCPLYLEGETTPIDSTQAKRNYVPLVSTAIASPDRPRGDDVACIYSDKEGREGVISVTRLRNGESSSDVFSAGKEQVTKRNPDAKVVYSRADFLDFIRYQGQGHRHMEIATYRLKVRASDAILALITDEKHGWVVQIEFVDLTTDLNSMVMKTAALSTRLTDSINANPP